MGYREDQFFNLYSNYSNFEAMQGNPAFMYPGKFAQKLGGRPGELRPVKTVQRGFMTSLSYNNPTLGLSSADAEKLKRRLFFQFNPSTITQSVNLTDEVMDPAMQSPGNLATPTPGNQNFMFEIFLDRQKEMNTSGTVNSAVEDILDPENLYKMKPESIGVLADLAVLYRIIGQGIDSATLKIALELSNRAKAFAGESSDVSSSSAGTVAPTEPGSGAPSSMDQNINAGNYAFLTAIPVRVVFSSLFMVDGFVTGTTVRFTKFNANMVPTQCSVAVAMQSVYIGFARERTVFNFALEDDTIPTATGDPLSPSDPGTGTGGDGSYTPGPTIGSEEDARTLAEFESKILKSFRLAVSDEKSYFPKYWHQSMRVYDSVGDPDPSNWQIYRMIEENKLWARFGFPLVSKDENDLISQWFDKGNQFSVEYGFIGRVFRSSYQRRVGASEPGSFVKLGEFSGGSHLVENSKGDSLVSTKDQWKKARHGWTSELVITPLGGILAGKNKEWLGLETQDEWDNYKTNAKHKLRVEIDFTMTVRLSSGKSTTSRNYGRKMVYSNIPVRGSYFDFTFDTIIRPVNNPGGGGAGKV